MSIRHNDFCYYITSMYCSLLQTFFSVITASNRSTKEVSPIRGSGKGQKQLVLLEAQVKFHINVLCEYVHVNCQISA